MGRNATAKTISYDTRFTQRLKTYSDDKYNSDLIYPLRKVVTRLQFRSDLCGTHLRKSAQILCVLPFEILPAIFRIRFTSEVAVRRCLLIFWLTEGKRYGDGSRTTIESDFNYVCNVFSCQLALLSAVSLHEERQRFCNTNGIRELNECTLAQPTFHN